jgi:tetratricopeptide (TPR) repeat protein
MATALTGAVDPFTSVKLAVALERFWELRGYTTEGRAYVRAALQLPSIRQSDLAHAWALYVSAQLADSQSDHAEGRALLERCLELRRPLGNPVEIAATLSSLSLSRLLAGDANGAKDAELEALQIFRELGDREGEAVGLLHLGQIATFTGDDKAATEYLMQSLAIAQDIKWREVEGACQLGLGELACHLPDWDKANAWFKRALSLFHEAADKRGEANALRWLGKCDLQAIDNVTARTRLEAAMRALHDLEMWDELLDCLEDAAELQHIEGHGERAIHVAAATAKARELLHLGRSPRAEVRQQARIAAYRAATAPAAFDFNWKEGELWSLDEAMLSALSPSSVSASEPIATAWRSGAEQRARSPAAPSASAVEIPAPEPR